MASAVTDGRFVPRFFETDYEDGRPQLNEAGRRAIMEEIERGKRTQA